MLSVPHCHTATQGEMYDNNVLQLPVMEGEKGGAADSYSRQRESNGKEPLFLRRASFKRPFSNFSLAAHNCDLPLPRYRYILMELWCINYDIFIHQLLVLLYLKKRGLEDFSSFSSLPTYYLYQPATFLLDSILAVSVTHRFQDLVS